MTLGLTGTVPLDMCLKAITNVSNENQVTIWALAIVLVIAYIGLIVTMLETRNVSRFLKEKKLLTAYKVWKVTRDDD